MASSTPNTSLGGSQKSRSSGTTTPMSIGAGVSQNTQTPPGLTSQQPNSVGVNLSKGSPAFHRAITNFRRNLTDEQLSNIQNTKYDDMCNRISQLQQEQETRKELKNLARIQSCLEAMHQFGKTIEVFLNTADAVAFVWGPIKFLLVTASNLNDSFETLLDAYQRIGEQLPLLREYERLFDEPHMLDVLELMYMDILEFHQHALNFYAMKSWKKIMHSTWSTFQTKFKGILEALRHHKELVENHATVSQYHRYKNDMKELQQNTKDTIAEEERKKRKAVKEWLAVGSLPRQDHKSFKRVWKGNASTGRWILDHGHFKEWLNPKSCAEPILWLNGIPGAGKTILASIVIEECRRKSDFKTSYFYCHHGNLTANNGVGVLRGLVDQLIDEYPQLLPYCYAKHISSREALLSSFSLAKKLLGDFCETIPKLFLIIDGVDEMELDDRRRLLQFLKDTVSREDDIDQGKLRVLLVSQDWVDIRDALHSSSKPRVIPKIVCLTPKDNHGDIQDFVIAQVKEIARDFELDDNASEQLRKLTVERANGMFLYAKLVMDYLAKLPTRGHLITASKLENFPVDLKDAYARIVQRIRLSASEEEWQKAKQLLGWMICCKRQLTWKEMQVALSIDFESQSIEWIDRRLRRHIYDICGSLVRVNGDRVALVHSTAKEYITEQTGDIKKPSVEVELATLCLGYLAFPCFDVEEEVDNVKLAQWMTNGHFAFQDYAVANWFYHVTAFVDTSKDLLEQGAGDNITKMTHAIDEFLDRYREEEFHENAVEAYRSKCDMFQGHFHKDLLALVSHIYTFQQKGSEVRHKPSIKKLEKALERNRKLIEELLPQQNPGDFKIFCQFYDSETRFKCTRMTCRYFYEGFKDAKSRNRHADYHNRPYQCEVPECLDAGGYLNSSDLEKHMRAWHPEKCDLAKSFNEMTIAPKGKAGHTCAICGKSFGRKQIWRDHVNSHNGERPYKCPECDRAFTRKNDMTRHQKNRHERRGV